MNISTPGIAAIVAGFLTCGGFAGEPEREASPADLQLFGCAPGPWGRVEWHYLYLEAPDWIVEKYDGATTESRWAFPGVEVVKLAKFLADAGVAPETVERWFADARVVRDGPQAMTLFPSAADVEALSGRSRSVIYEELARSPQNGHYAEPLRILDADVDVWLGRREIRPELRELFKKLIYLKGSVLCFSDLPVLVSQARSALEARDLTQLMTRVRGVMAYLKVGEGDDTAALGKYWTAGFRRNDVLPTLDSVRLLPGGGRLGFSHLLTAEARKLVYTYPTPTMAAQGDLPDCHWTALNFFSRSRQNAFLDVRLARAEMLEGHDRVEPPYSYGDILVFVNKAAGAALHSCVYLCDDLVFTKNGESMLAPWSISTLSDVRRIYSVPDEIRAYRRRWSRQR